MQNQDNLFTTFACIGMAVSAMFIGALIGEVIVWMLH